MPDPLDMTDHPWRGTEDGHNCVVCRDDDDVVHLCWREAHPTKWGDRWGAAEILDYDEEPSNAVRTDTVRQAGQG